MNVSVPPQEYLYSPDLTVPNGDRNALTQTLRKKCEIVKCLFAHFSICDSLPSLN